MIEILAAGKLAGKPEQLRSKSGRTYVRAKLRVPLGADEVVFVRLSAFSESACASLLALDDGDAVSVAGTLKAGAWVDRDGAAKPNLDVVVAQVLTVYHLKRRRDAVQDAGEPKGTDPPAPTRTASPAPSGARRPRAPHPKATPPAADGYIDFGEASDDAWLRGESR